MPTKIFPAYLFLGEEGFLKQEAIEKLKSTLLDKNTQDLNYNTFYAKDKNFNVSQMLDDLDTMPFLSKRRLVILKEADSVTVSAKTSILSYLESPRESSVFVIESDLPAIKGDFLLKASKAAHLIYHRKLTDSSINTWLVKRAGLAGKKISTEAIDAIKENLPNDLRVISSNMDNIILYVGKRPLIKKQDIENIVGVSPSHTAFDLIDAIGEKDAKRALRIFSTLKRDKKRETELLGLLAWNARMLLRIKELFRIKNNMEMRQDLDLSPRVFERILRHASMLKKKEILALLDEILRSDLAIKTGTSPGAVIERLIVRMCI
ncbi:MAG: DNA polymerase III subunit delta [Candidatus Gorgyraea atricola]|nr:DNA polymerase III subunit delta [Candidatus Gorgyraea atricola]